MMITRKDTRRNTRKNMRRNTRKYQKGGRINDKIHALLQNVSNTSNESNASSILSSNMQRLKKVMKTYIASPWWGDPDKPDEDDKTFSIANYKRVLKEYTEKTENTLNSYNKQIKLCQEPLNKNVKKQFKPKLCRHHSGNLFEHSQWSALQILQWKTEEKDIVKGMNINTAMIAAFFHDIGKGGDCVKTHTKEECWLDMYSDDKYDKQGDGVHPTYSANMILGKLPFHLTCNKNDDGINIKDLLEREFPGINIKEIALAAEMHWEFGRLNILDRSESATLNSIDNSDLKEIKLKEIKSNKIHIYYTRFFKACDKCGLDPSEMLLRLCMVVACADIAAGSNRRLRSEKTNGIIAAKETFIGTDPWVLFGMDKKYMGYHQSVLDSYKIEELKARTHKNLLKKIVHKPNHVK